MTNVIGITGCPAVGKKTVGRVLASRLGLRFVDTASLLREGSSKIEDGEVVIDVKRGRRVVEGEAEKGDVVIAGLYLFDLLSPRLVDTVVVLRCDPRILFYRYLKRNYPLKKVRENLTAEFLDYCYVEAVKVYGKGRVSQLDASRRSPEALARIIGKIHLSGKALFEPVDWLSLVPEFPELVDLLA